MNLPEIPITIDDLPQILTFYFKDEMHRALIQNNLLQIIASNSGFDATSENPPNITATLLSQDVDKMEISVKMVTEEKYSSGYDIDWEIPF